MKDTIIKYSLLTALVIGTGIFVYSNPRAMTFEEENLLIFPREDQKTAPKAADGGDTHPGGLPAQAMPQKKKKIVPVKIEKNDKGVMKAKWGLLAEYDLQNNRPGMNLKKLIDKKVEVSGFMMPLDYSAKQIKEFLLLPYVPSCSHVPPPPNNQIIMVKVEGKQGVKPLYYPVQMEGVLKVSKTKKSIDPYMPSGIFEMTVSKVEKLQRRKKKKKKKK